MDELLTNGVQHRHNLTISGGGEKSNYYLSAGYSKQFGVVKYADDNNTKYNLRMNYDYRLAKWLKLETKVSLDNQKRTDIGSNGAWVIGEAMFDMPNFPIYNANGEFFTQGGWSNAIALAKESETATFNTREMNGNFRLIADITDGLVFNAQVGLNYKNKNNEDIAKAIPLYTWDGDINYYTGAGSPEQSAVDRTTEETIYQNYTAYLNYNKNFGLDHHLDAMLGMAYEAEEVRMFMARRDNFITDELWELNLGGTGNMKNDAKAEHWATSSAFARIGYSFKNKYILETNFRYDGSSRFPSDERWAFFPSASVGWRISQEPWWNVKSEHISNAKVRFSWGSLGNAAGLSNYQYIQTLGISKSDYILDGLRQNYMSSPAALPGNLTWETATTYDIGVDLGFFDNRLTVSGDYYIRKTTDMIVNGPTVPDVFGASSPKGNYADMSTYGYELSLEWKDGFDLAGKRFNYSIKGTLADYYSVIDKFNNANMSLSEYANQSLDKNYYEGMRIGEIWGFVSNGLWQDQAGIDAAEAAAKAAGQSYYNPLMQTSKTYKLYPGDIKFEDLNGNGYIDRGQNTVDDPGDRKIIGNEEPRYIYSFTLSADWNNIWVSAFFQGVGKQDWYPSNEASTFWGQYNRPYNQMPSWHVDNYWTPENPDAFLPRYTGYYAPFYGGHKNANTRYLMNAAYLRLKNIQVGYNLPSEWIKKLHLTNVGIYLSGENLFTWSPLYKYSKDVNVSNIGESDKDLTSSNSGDGYNYPMMKSFSIGLNVTF